MRALVRLLPLAALLAFAAPAPAPAAQDALSFSLEPVGPSADGYFAYDAQPGGVVKGRVLVINSGTAAGTARLDAVDATTGATTGAVYETVGGRSEDIGAWLELERDEVTLAPGASAEIAFTIRVPSDARRGEHLGGIVAAPMENTGRTGQADGRRDFRVDVVNQSILAVQVDLPGEARQLLAVRDVRTGGNPGYQTLILGLSNPGERMVRGRGSVEILGSDGATVSRQRFAIDTFLPRTRIDYPLVLRGDALVPGDYRARVALDWETGRERQELAFAVSRENIEQAFGSEGVARLPDAGRQGGGASLAVPLAGIVLALLLGAAGSMLYFRRQARRLEERLLARQAPPPADPRPAAPMAPEPGPRPDEPRFSASGEREEPQPRSGRR